MTTAVFSLSVHAGVAIVDADDPQMLDRAVVIGMAVRRCQAVSRILVRRKGERFFELRLIGGQWHFVDRSMRHKVPHPSRYAL